MANAPDAEAEAAFPATCPACETVFWRDDGFSNVVGLVRNNRQFGWECPACQHRWQRTEPPYHGLRLCALKVW